jgi:hypothetical protein
VRIDLHDAIKMYAKACHAWYGSRACNVALRRAEQLRERGDWEGVKVWEQLASELSRKQTRGSHRGPRVGPQSVEFSRMLTTRPAHLLITQEAIQDAYNQAILQGQTKLVHELGELWLTVRSHKGQALSLAEPGEPGWLVTRT